MGRRKKYFTDEEKKSANNANVKEFYTRNKESVDSKARCQYWIKKINNHISSGNLEMAKIVYNRAIDKGIIFPPEIELNNITSEEKLEKDNIE